MQLPNHLRPVVGTEVTLVTPPSVFLLDERVFVSLGILKVTAALESQGVMVSHLDLAGVKNYLDALTMHLRGFQGKFIGITSTTPQLPLVVPMVKIIRKERPDLRIILGGPHVTLTSCAVKMERKAGRIARAHQALIELEKIADVLVSGDGEFAVFVALGPNPPKIIDADDPDGGLFLSDALYESTPFPSRHLVDVSSYHYEIEARRSTSLIAQLGCPFSCGFCGGRNSKSLRVIRTRSIESIIREMRLLYKTYGFTGFMFYDDELNLSKGVVELMDAIRRLQDELHVEFRLRGFVKSELFTPAQAVAMYQAGFRWLLSGFESGDSRMLKNMNKRSTVDTNSRAVDIARNVGLKVKALMSVGHPGESFESTRNTQEWLLKIQPGDFDCSVITTYPGTPYYDEAIPHETLPDIWTYTYKSTGDRLHACNINFLEVMDHYKGDPKAGYQSYVFTDHLSRNDIVAQRNWIESSVREKLAIPYPQARAALLYEHSMGQASAVNLPDFLLRRTPQKQVDVFGDALDEAAI